MSLGGRCSLCASVATIFQCLAALPPHNPSSSQSHSTGLHLGSAALATPDKSATALYGEQIATSAVYRLNSRDPLDRRKSTQQNTRFYRLRPTYQAAAPITMPFERPVESLIRGLHLRNPSLHGRSASSGAATTLWSGTFVRQQPSNLGRTATTEGSSRLLSLGCPKRNRCRTRPTEDPSHSRRLILRFVPVSDGCAALACRRQKFPLSGVLAHPGTVRSVGVRRSYLCNPLSSSWFC